MPLIDLSRLSKHYLVHVRCTNCGNIQDLKIPKGEKKEDYLDKGECEHCGCIGVLVLRQTEKNQPKKETKTKVLWE